MIFKYIKGLSELENEENWGDAIMMLYNLWQKEKDSIGVNLRLISECWLVLVEPYCVLDTSKYSYDLVQSYLIEATEYGIEKWIDEENYINFVGYMIYLSPYYFYFGREDRLYLEWEKIGMDIAINMYKKNPDNIFSKIMYFGLDSKFRCQYKKAVAEVSNNIDKYFTTETEIERHFRSIWK